MQIRTILCPIDYSDVSAQELDVAVEVARAFGARLVVHHNRAAISPGLARQWDWDSTHCTDHYTEAEAERRMQSVLNGLPKEVRAEGVVSTGPVGMAVLSLAEQLPADLIVLGSHGWSTDDHASVAERLIGQAPCAVLTFTEGNGAPDRFRIPPDAEAPLPVVVTTDFSATGQHAVEYACALAATLPLQIELLHVLSPGRRPDDDVAHVAEARLRDAVPERLAGRMTARVRSGNAGDEILAHLAEVRPAFAVLGEHARDLVRRLLTRDTTRVVMHGAPCPVWVVPARAAA